MRRTTIALATALSLVGAGAASAGLLPGVGWTPANAGILWWQPNDPSYPLSFPRQPPGEPNGAWWLTRRIAASPHVPGAMLLGSFFHGAYASEAGAGWGTTTPACWLPVNPPAAVPPSQHAAYREARRIAVAATGLDACGVEGIVYDPVLPSRVYASAYDVKMLSGFSATLGDGGVYVSDTLGLTWRKLLGGIRGNGLAVQRALGAPATIVAGYIQEGGAVGPTPSNGSLSISHDDGRTWRNVALPSSGCADTPLSSQRITPTVAIHPSDPDRIFAGTNAGLYDSSDGGSSWTLRVPACGGVWGVALSTDGSTIYIGDKDGVVSRAQTSSMSFAQVVDLGNGKIQSLIVDAGDPRTLYAAAWAPSAGGSPDLRVWRVSTSGGSARLDDSVLRDVVPVDQAWPSNVPKPFPLTPRMNDGTAPSLFLSQNPFVPGALYVSTLLRGVFVRLD